MQDSMHEKGENDFNFRNIGVFKLYWHDSYLFINAYADKHNHSSQ